jgi:hypothetical protein
VAAVVGSNAYSYAGHVWCVSAAPIPNTEPCQNCGLQYIDFADMIQLGQVVDCVFQQRLNLQKDDGVIIIGPPS